jgi:hypothetical protein
MFVSHKRVDSEISIPRINQYRESKTSISQWDVAKANRGLEVRADRDLKEEEDTRKMTIQRGAMSMLHLMQDYLDL